MLSGEGELLDQQRRGISVDPAYRTDDHRWAEATVLDLERVAVRRWGLHGLLISAVLADRIVVRYQRRNRSLQFRPE